MLMFASEVEFQRLLHEHDELVRRCAHGEMSFNDFCDKYNNYWSFYALDGHESDDEERTILERYEDRIELHWLIAFDILGQLCSEEDAQREVYIQAGRFDSTVAQQRLVWCAVLFCTYLEVVARAAFARVTLAKMSEALAVQMKGLGSMLCCAT